MKKIILASIFLLMGTWCYSQNVYDPINFEKNEVIFSTSSTKISVIDPTPSTNSSGMNFPGGRGANQLVIYTPLFGDRTNTNEFGTEAVVQNNIVTMISGANSFIPSDGIVISGHGTAKAWMNKNIAVGTKIYIDLENNTISAYTTSDSYLYEAEDKISETKKMIDYYKSRTPNYSIKEVNQHIELAQKYVKIARKDTDDFDSVKSNSNLAISEANAAMASVLPNISNELKGIWIRPVQKNASQISEAVEKIHSMGIDNIFLETFYHGKTIFQSKTMAEYGFTTQNEQFEGFDPLKTWISEAHKRNMKVHIWFQSFYVGNTPPANKNILSVNPEWGNKIKNDYDSAQPTRSKSEHNGYFLDPANPQVQDFLTRLLTEIICTYHPDGINLDYIRYPQAISKNESGSWGYTEYARNDFKNMYGKDPIDILKTDELWKDWDGYRREHITNFVRKIGTLGRQNNIYVSAVIFPDVENALATKQQDWRTWSKRNYINGFTPLFLTYDPDMVASMMADVNSIKSPVTDIYAGLFVTFMGGSNEDLVRQIHETRKLNANGVILFDYAHTTPKYSNMLANSAFKRALYIKSSGSSNGKKFLRLFKR